MLSQVFAFSGRLARVSDVVNKAEDLARSGDQPISIVQATAIRAIIALRRRDYALCLEAAEDEALVSHAHGFVRWLAHRMLMTGIGRVFNHGDIGSLDAAKRGIDDWKATGAKLYVPTFCAYLADCALHFGREDMARLAVDDGIAQATINHGHLVLSELQRLDALIHERSGVVDDALTRLEMPIASSQRQGAWLFHLHGCMAAGTGSGSRPTERCRWEQPSKR